MMGTEDDKQSRPESEAGTRGGAQSSPPDESESATRAGTKVDIRGSGGKGSGGEKQETKDQMRDGTKDKE